jgi:hypothetical protein
MASARDQLRETSSVDNRSKKSGPPPTYPRPSPVPKHINPKDNEQVMQQQQQQRPPLANSYPPIHPHHGQQQQRHRGPQHYPPPQAPVYNSDASSVYSALSGDSCHHAPQQTMYPMPQYYHHQPPYPPNCDPNQVPGYNGVYYPHAMPNGWVDPNMMYAMQMDQAHYYGHPPLPNQAAATSPEGEAKNEINSTPRKSPADMPSPFWSHLDQATLAMGLATPAKASPPQRDGMEDEKDGDSEGFAANAQPLLLQHGVYYGYNNGAVRTCRIISTRRRLTQSCSTHSTALGKAMARRLPQRNS